MRSWSFALVALAVLGLVLILVGGDVLVPIGIVLMGGAAVGAVSLGFFAVGRSEDRAREEEARARGPEPEAERPGTAGSPPGGHHARAGTPRSPVPPAHVGGGWVKWRDVGISVHRPAHGVL